MDLTDRIWGVLFKPVPALQRITAERPVAQGLLIYIAVVALTIIINQGIQRFQPIEEMLNIPASFLWLFFILGIIFSLLFLLASAGFLSLVSEIIYKRGNSLGLLTGFCFAILPGALGALVQYGSLLLRIEWLGVLFSVIALLWAMVLQIIAVKTALNLSNGQALLIYFIPPLIIAVIIIASILAAAFAIPQLF